MITTTVQRINGPMPTHQAYNPDAHPATITGMGEPHYHLKCENMLATAPAWMSTHIGGTARFIYRVVNKKTHADYLKMTTNAFHKVTRFACYATSCLKDNQIDTHYPTEA